MKTVSSGGYGIGKTQRLREELATPVKDAVPLQIENPDDIQTMQLVACPNCGTQQYVSPDEALGTMSCGSFKCNLEFELNGGTNDNKV